MPSVQQSGSITPGHLASWVTDGVLKDAGASITTQQVLASLSNANFNDTGDQPLLLPAELTAFQLTAILITNASLSLTTAAGGFYPLPSKAGAALVAAGQVYSSLTASSKLLSATLTGAVATTRYSRDNLPNWAVYFALTTIQGAAVGADIFLIGLDLSNP